MSLSPDQFPPGPLYHGFKRRPQGDTLLPGDALGQRDYGISDTSRVYATPNPQLAWDYAEQKASVAMDEMAYSGDNQVRRSYNTFLQDWSTDVDKPGPVSPHVAEVRLEGEIDMDPHVQLDGSRGSAFRGSSASIGKGSFVPPGAQTSMLPNPTHGGRYVSQYQLDNQADVRMWDRQAALDEMKMDQNRYHADLDTHHPQLFPAPRLDPRFRGPREKRTTWRSGLLSNLPPGGIG